MKHGATCVRLTWETIKTVATRCGSCYCCWRETEERDREKHIDEDGKKILIRERQRVSERGRERKREIMIYREKERTRKKKDSKRVWEKETYWKGGIERERKNERERERYRKT